MPLFIQNISTIPIIQTYLRVFQLFFFQILKLIHRANLVVRQFVSYEIYFLLNRTCEHLVGITTRELFFFNVANILTSLLCYEIGRADFT